MNATLESITMLVRMLATLALLIGLQVAPSTATAATGSVSYRVEHRKAGGKWSVNGVYARLATAESEVGELRGKGYETRIVTLGSTESRPVPAPAPRPAPPPRPAPAPAPAPGIPSGATMGGISVVSYADAVKAFNAARSRTDIAFRYPSDGCYARAHLMALQMQRAGLKPGKAWAFDDAAMDDPKKTPRLFASTKAHPRGSVAWKYHVAPALKVKQSDGKVYTYVIDPSLFDRPETLGAWQRRMTPPTPGFTPRMEVTAWGHAPSNGRGARYPGTGYWPAGDPGDLTKAAVATMREYKPHEGTAWVPPTPGKTPTPPPVRPTPPPRPPVRTVVDSRDDLSP